MDTLNAPSGSMSLKSAFSRKNLSSGTVKELWAAVRTGSVLEVEIALINVKKQNGNINEKNTLGCTALHMGAWRNHLPIVRRLLAAGADPNARDGESGWSSLHRALHFGHLAVAGLLIESGGSLVLEDTQGRTPVDLTSGPLKQSLLGSTFTGAKEVFSWGNGSNYQLGIGTTGILRVPGRVDALQGCDIVSFAAAKFHTVALTATGEVYSWGFGRGGRLGHPDFDIHSGQVAVITPRQIMNSFGCRPVRVIAVAKHHTIVATDGGEVYTWGSNREGRLGYTSVDTQPTPRRVNTLKAKVVKVSAANKHNAVLTEAGEVYTWGCNLEGQLGYGTSNSTSNYTPRLVECLKVKKIISVSVAKYHTVVLGAEGEVYTWGYKMVNPRRVTTVRNVRKAGVLPLKFHISERLHMVAISAGTTHSTALSDDGLIFYWFSADSHLRCRQLLSMAAHQAVAVSSGKYRTGVVTSTGDVYVWDGESAKAETVPVPVRVHGIKHATILSVGENHSVVGAAFVIPNYPLGLQRKTTTSCSRFDEVDVDSEGEDVVRTSSPPHGCIDDSTGSESAPSLKDLCQRVIAQQIVEPKNALQLLEFADSLGADLLRKHCEELVLRNLDYVLTMAPVLFGHVRSSLLAEVEKALDASSTQPWSHRRLPTPSATLPAVIDSEEEEDESSINCHPRGKKREVSLSASFNDRMICESFLQPVDENGEAISKQLRAVKKKLQQVEALELKQLKGHTLDDQQLAKLSTKRELQEALVSLEAGIIPEPWRKDSKSEVTNTREGKEKSSSTDEGSSCKAGGSRQSLREKKKKNKGQALNANKSQAPSNESRLKKSKSPVDIKEPGVTPDYVNSTTTVSSISSPDPRLNNFRTISGFTSVTPEAFPLDGERSGSFGNKQVNKVGVPELVGQEAEKSSRVPRKMATLGKKVVKGGLSVFLSGALEAPIVTPPPPPPPVTPKVEGPAWGGANIPKGSPSLLTIQLQQKSEPRVDFGRALKVGSGKGLSRDRATATPKQTDLAIPTPVVGEDAETSSARIPLSHFVRTSPIAVNPRNSSRGQVDNSPPPWAAATSGTTAPSLRDIQMQQVKSKANQRPQARGSPQLGSPLGPPVSSMGGTNPEVGSSETPSRWFKPDVADTSTIRCIQIEEKAMKELRQMYKNVNVKLVRQS